jgi:hypothetical protein
MTDEPFDRFDESKRALEGIPAPDLWAEAERRAEDGTVVPLAAVPPRHPRHVGRWIAAAAVVVLVAGTVAALASDDEAGVEARSGTPSTTTQPEPTTYQASGGCKLGITGEPLPHPAVTSFASPDGAGGTMLVGQLNDIQTYAVQVPGEVVKDLVGERVEDIQLHRGTAQLWFQEGPNSPVQVRWVTGGQDGCETFTVYVEGGTEDENRHAAVDLADRLLVGHELENEVPPSTTTTTVATTTVEGDLAGVWEVVELRAAGDPVAVPQGEVLVEFAPAQVGWNDGCAGHSGAATYGSASVTVSEPVDQEPACPADDGRDLINALFASDTIGASVVGDRAELTAGDRLVVLQRS